jgi:hypothetical protein
MSKEMINELVNLLRHTKCDVSYEVKDKPQGVHITIDVTQEQMDEIVNRMQPN